MRDRRGENSFSQGMRDTHERLMGWADWQRSVKQSRGGGMSTIARLMKYGPQGAGAQDAPTEMPDHIKIIDLAVAALGEGHERHIIVHLYCEEEPFEAIARELHISVDTVKYKLRAARLRIGGYVHGYYASHESPSPS